LGVGLHAAEALTPGSPRLAVRDQGQLGEGLALPANPAISAQGSGQREVSAVECSPLTSHRDGRMVGSRVMFIGRMAAGPQHARRCPRVAPMEGLKVRPHPPERGLTQLPPAEGGSVRARVTRAGGILYVYTQHVPLHGRGAWTCRSGHGGWHLPAGTRVGWVASRLRLSVLVGGGGLVSWPVC